MELTSQLLIGILLILASLLYWLVKRQDYFKNLGIPYIKSLPLYGAFGESFFGRYFMNENVYRLCNQPQVKNKPFFGIFVFHKPGLMINDAELIKRVLTKDFRSFANRYTASDVHDPLGNYNLVTVKQPLWRTIRTKMSPFFSSGKLKQMYYLMDKIGDALNAHIYERLGDEDSVDIDVRNLTSLFTTDVVASCAYGVEANSLKNPEGEFREAGRAMFGRSFRRALERTSMFMIPQLMRVCGFKFFSVQATNFIDFTIKYVMTERMKTGNKRNDLIDTLIEIKNSDDGNKMTLEMLTAQAAIFFSAGFETSSSSQTFALHEISRNQDVQQRLRNEIKEMMMRTGGKVTYNSLMDTKEMPYLQQVVLEAMRMYPVLPVFDRECTNPDGYSLEPFSDFTVPPGMPVYIPVYSIHRDERFFPDPKKFDPERFSPENIGKIQPFTFLPFGSGPRNCIAARFGFMQVKTGIVKMLKDFRIEQTKEGMLMNEEEVITRPDNWLTIIKDPVFSS